MIYISLTKVIKIYMKIVSILNQKGGVGKTTLATNITSKLHLNGSKVLLLIQTLKALLEIGMQ